MKLNLRLCQSVVGTKQVKRAILKENVEKVYIAQNAESKVTLPIVSLCKEKGLPYEYVETMEKLGEGCGIGINAACAAILI